jgi:hypothetical protein
MNMKNKNIIMIIIITLLLCVVGGNEGFAQVPPPPAGGGNIPLDTCSNNPNGFFDYTKANQVSTMLQDVVTTIYADVNAVTGQLYLSFVNPAAAFFGIGSYFSVVAALMTLAVIFSAIAFMFGFISMTGWQVVSLLFRLGFVIWLISPSAAALAAAVPVNNANANVFLSTYSLQHLLYTFFMDVPNEMIEIMINIGKGTPNAPLTGNVAAPFLLLDNIIQVVFSPRMIVTVLASFGAGPYGPLMAAALGWSIFQLFMALLKATQIYVLALVIKSILIGLSPVFFPMMLFQRTRQIFQGWINQLVNFSLQPIFLFAFLAFFANLVASAARDLLPQEDVHVCYVKSGKQAATPFEMHNWRYMCCPAGGTCQPYEGKWTFEGPVNCPGGPKFPLNHINLIVFLLLTHIMKQLSTVSVAIAAELSQGMMRLNTIDSSFNQWFGKGANKSGFDPRQTPAAKPKGK